MHAEVWAVTHVDSLLYSQAVATGFKVSKKIVYMYGVSYLLSFFLAILQLSAATASCRQHDLLVPTCVLQSNQYAS